MGLGPIDKGTPVLEPPTTADAPPTVDKRGGVVPEVDTTPPALPPVETGSSGSAAAEQFERGLHTPAARRADAVTTSGMSAAALKAKIADELRAAGFNASPGSVEALVDDYVAFRATPEGKHVRNPNLMFNDYGQNVSNDRRSVLIDMSTGEVMARPEWVSHGRGTESPGSRFGRATVPHNIPAHMMDAPYRSEMSPFSDEPNSEKTPLGLFRVAERIRSGANGPTLDLEGVSAGVNESTNERRIGITGGEYVGARSRRIGDGGKATVGRSRGSMVMSEDAAHRLLPRLRGGMAYNYAPIPGWRDPPQVSAPV